MSGARAWQEKARLEFLAGRATELLTSGQESVAGKCGWDKAETHLAELASHWSDNRAVDGPETEWLALLEAFFSDWGWF